MDADGRRQGAPQPGSLGTGNPQRPALRRRGGPSAVVLAVIGYALYLPVLVGFLLHTSPRDGAVRVLGKYSPGYAVFLGMLVCVGVVIAPAARALARPTRLTRLDGTTLVIAGWRKVGFVWAGIALGIVAAVILLEVIVAMAFPPEPPPWRPRDWEPFFERWPSRGDPPMNSRGWIGPEMDREKPPGVYRIFALGGSTTFLEKYMKPEEIFTHRLARSLQAARPNWRIEMVNAACYDHTTMHSLIKYAVLVRDFQPDCVIVMHACNDWAQNCDLPMIPMIWRRPGFERDYAHNASYLAVLTEQSGLGRPQRPLWYESRVCRRLAELAGETFLSDRERWRGVDEGRRQRAREAVAQALPVFRRNLRTLGQLVAADGAAYILASQPTMFRPDAQDDPDRLGYWSDYLVWSMTDGMRQYNDAVRETAGELDARFVDLERAVPARWDYFLASTGDGIHMSPAGCDLAAQALKEAILPLIPEAPSPGPMAAPGTLAGVPPPAGGPPTGPTSPTRLTGPTGRTRRRLIPPTGGAP